MKKIFVLILLINVFLNLKSVIQVTKHDLQDEKGIACTALEVCSGCNAVKGCGDKSSCDQVCRQVEIEKATQHPIGPGGQQPSTPSAVTETVSFCTNKTENQSCLRCPECNIAPPDIGICKNHQCVFDPSVKVLGSVPIDPVITQRVDDPSLTPAYAMQKAK